MLAGFRWDERLWLQTPTSFSAFSELSRCHPWFVPNLVKVKFLVVARFHRETHEFLHLFLTLELFLIVTWGASDFLAYHCPSQRTHFVCLSGGWAEGLYPLEVPPPLLPVPCGEL